MTKWKNNCWRENNNGEKFLSLLYEWSHFIFTIPCEVHDSIIILIVRWGNEAYRLNYFSQVTLLVGGKAWYVDMLFSLFKVSELAYWSEVLNSFSVSSKPEWGLSWLSHSDRALDLQNAEAQKCQGQGVPWEEVSHRVVSEPLTLFFGNLPFFPSLLNSPLN